MTITNFHRRSGALAALALTMTVGLSACGSDDETDTTTTDEPTAAETTEEAPADAGADTFGEGCKLIPQGGAGSFNGMATAPVASAASANPLLKTLVAAVTEAGLVDTLNSADALTVFAPTDDAFGKIPEKDLNAVLADKTLLTKILTHHVIAGQLSPDELAGEHETLAGDKITITGSEGSFEVDETEKAAILCGNIPTANATVYVVDTVLMPQS